MIFYRVLSYHFLILQQCFNESVRIDIRTSLFDDVTQQCDFYFKEKCNNQHLSIIA